MNRILLLFCLLLPFSGFSQRNSKDKKEAQEYFEKIFSHSKRDFNTFEAPAEFADEPLVVLCKSKHLSFLRNTSASSSAYFPTSILKGAFRTRILINDEAMVKEFSEFYYQESVLFSVSLIKKDKKKKEIDLADAVEVETEVPGFYKNAYHKSSYFKVAIPNLEVGDILDYYKVFEEPFFSSNPISFAVSLATEYPVVNEKIIFDIDKFWGFYYDSYNGAPAFKQDMEGGIDYNGRKRKIVKRFVLKNENAPGLESERWSNPYESEPMYKIMALYKDSDLYNKKDPYQKGFEYENFFKDKTLTAAQVKFYKNAINRVIDRKELKTLRPEAKVNLLYQAVQYSFLSSQFESIANSSNPKSTSLEISRNFVQSYDSFSSLLFSKMLKDYDIDSEIVLVPHNYSPDLENALAKDEVEFGVYVPSTKKYYWAVNSFRQPGEMPSGVLGAEGIKVSSTKLRRNNKEFSKVKIPDDSSDKNVFTTKLDIDINSDNTLSFKNEVSCKGSFKRAYRPMFCYNTTYFMDITESMISQKKKDKMRKRENKSKDKVALEAIKNEYSEDKKEFIENWVSEDYKVTKFGDYKLLDNGYGGLDDEIKLSYDFTSKEYLKKAGPNLILDAGALITEQVKLEEDELTNRKTEIVYDNPRTIKNEITIRIPNGKTAQGLESLNYNIDNPFAKFEASAVQTGDQLVIKTTKVYKKKRVPAANYQSIVEFLQAADEFYEKKIIIK